MARSRVYSHDVRCPACGYNWMPRHGSSKGRQVDRCGDCKRYHSPDAAYTRPSASDQERGLALYQEGVSLSAIARRFGVTPAAVSRWVKKGARRTVPVAPPGPAAHRRPCRSAAGRGDCL